MAVILQLLFHQQQAACGVVLPGQQLKTVPFVKFHCRFVVLRHMQPQGMAAQTGIVENRPAEKLHAAAPAAKFRRQVQQTDPSIACMGAPGRVQIHQPGGLVLVIEL